MLSKLTLISLCTASLVFSAALSTNTLGQDRAQCSAERKVAAVANFGGGSSVVISEAYGGSESGGAYNADFIELYNPSPVPADISDFSVQYYTAGQINGGAPTSTAHIPAATIMAPFEYYVIRVSPDDRGGSPLPCSALNASASFAETGIEASGGKLVLTSTGADLPDCTSSLNVVDRLGYGNTPVLCNETANAGGHNGFTSTQRREMDPDTDVNSQDFYSGNAPTPCNGLMASTAAEVSVGGRVSDSAGRGLSKVRVILQDGDGNLRSTQTSELGFYNFEGVQSGSVLIVSVSSKRYSFAQQSHLVSLDDAIFDLDFVSN